MSRRILLSLLVAVAVAGCDYFVSTQERIERAEKHFAAHEYRAALIDVRNALKREPDNTKAWLLAARLDLQLGDVAAAEWDLKRGLESGAAPSGENAVLQAKIWLAKNDGQGLLAEIDAGRLQLVEPQRALYRGKALLLLRRFDEAAQAFDAAVSRDPRLTAAHLGLASVHARTDFARALADLDAIRAYDPVAPDQWAARGSLYAAHGQYREAEEALITAVANDHGTVPAPAAATALALLTEVRLALGKVDAAAVSQQRLADLTPRGLMTRFLGARVALLRRQYDSAAATLEILVHESPDFAPARRLLSAALIGQGNLLQAEEQLRAYLAKWPGDIDGRRLLSQVELRLDQPDKARETLAAGGAPDDTTTLLNLAEFDVRTGHGEAAQKNLEKAVSADPANFRARFALAQLAARRGDLAGARTRLNELRKADPKAVEPRLLLAAIDFRSTQAAEADTVLAEALAAAPDRADVQNAVGRLYFAAGRYDDALVNFRSALDKDAGKAAYWLDMSRAQAALNQLTAAQSAAERALALQPDWIAAVEMLVRLDLATGHGDGAIARAAAQRAKFPQSAPAHLLEGEAMLANKRYADADSAYEAAARIAPTAFLASRSHQSRRLGHLPNATAPLTAWLENHPRDETMRMLLADACMTSGKTAAAIEQYEAITQANPRNLVALNNLATLYGGAKDARALSTAKRAFDLAPKNAAIADTYGWIALHAGQTDEALKVLAASAAEAPQAADIQYHYAAALARAGDRTQAAEVLRKALAGDRPFEGRADAQALLSTFESR
ncbi:MAG: tetratricopeptide repeat protein [Steroidobacteraceae bacterium]